MGSPLSSFLAEAVMQDLENKAVTNNNDIKTWDRYVDDVFATVKLEVTIARKVLPLPQGVKGSMHNLPE